MYVVWKTNNGFYEATGDDARFFGKNLEFLNQTPVYLSALGFLAGWGFGVVPRTLNLIGRIGQFVIATVTATIVGGSTTVYADTPDFISGLQEVDPNSTVTVDLNNGDIIWQTSPQFDSNMFFNVLPKPIDAKAIESIYYNVLKPAPTNPQINKAMGQAAPALGISGATSSNQPVPPPPPPPAAASNAARNKGAAANNALQGYAQAIGGANVPPAGQYGPSTQYFIGGTRNINGTYKPILSTSFTFQPPIVLDLNNDGFIQTSGVDNSTVFFEYDKAGQKQQTGWTTDGLLIQDSNNNNIVDNASEFFGNSTQTGWDELRSIDSNGNGKIDSGDAVWNQLKVWQDSNQNGVTDTGELKTLADWNIQSIATNRLDATITKLANGNTWDSSGHFTRTDGSVGVFTDVGFLVNRLNTQSVANNNLTLDLFGLPWLRGSGSVLDLPVAMANNAALKTTITGFFNQTNLNTLWTQMDNFLYQWAGTDGFSPTAMQGSYNAQKLHTIARFMGGVNPPANIPPSSVANLDNAWLLLKEKFYTDLVAQVQAGQGLGLQYQYDQNTVVVKADTISKLITANTNTNLQQGARVAAKTLVATGALSIPDIQTAVNAAGSGTELLGFTAGADSIFEGTAGNDSFTNNSAYKFYSGMAGDDTIVANAQGLYSGDDGNDTLTNNVNGSGVFMGDAGNDTLNNYGYYAFLDGGDGDDLIRGYANSDGVYQGGAGNDTMSLESAGTLVGGTGNDTLSNNGSQAVTEIAGIGNDTLQTMSLGNTDFIHSAGDGDDTIYTAVPTNANVVNTVQLNWNYSAATITRLNNDLVITSTATAGDKVTIKDMFVNDTRIQKIVFSDKQFTAFDLVAPFLTPLNGTSGNDTLTASATNRVLKGGLGNDEYWINDTRQIALENANEGVDTVNATVSYQLGENLENLYLTGSGNLNGDGNILNNTLIGNSGINILKGGAGNDYLAAGLDTVADTMMGGLGDDWYKMDTAVDIVIENPGEGIDTVAVEFSHTLQDHFENLELNGVTNINGTGNTLANNIRGNGANNVLYGLSGDDTLIGAGGGDTLFGGTGNDTYDVDITNDIIIENAGEGIDTVVSYNFNTTLGANLENLTLTGLNNINGSGNELNNVLRGNNGVNVLTGGAGDDTYYISVGDTVIENANEGNDTVITDDANYVMGANIENLTFTGTANMNATGNANNNVFIGNTGVNNFSGAAGDDTYTISTGDTVTEAVNAGTDTVITDVNYYTLGANIENGTISGVANNELNGNALSNVLNGNAGNNKLVGWDGNDTLDGKVGNDEMLGGLGNDTYYIDNVNDKVIETYQDSGTDQIISSVSFNVAEFIENITLTGTGHINSTGNWGNNLMLGNTGNNILDGGTGLDTLTGGAGDDTYVVDDMNDVINENANQGTDTVISKGNTRTLGANQENLTLQGNAAVYADGNSLNNVLTGSDLYNKLTGFDGNDTLDGRAGADDLVGGNGDDTYIVDNLSDNVYEAWNETGNDKVLSSVNYTLTDYIEQLTLTGVGNISGTGNWGSNTITGNIGNNSLTGGVGNDTLDGGAGNDTLQGGGDSDTYKFGKGYGTDTINDSAGSAEVLKLGENTNIAFWFNGNDLQVGFKGATSDVATIQGQKLAANQIERIERKDGKFLTNVDINSVIAQMTSYGTNNGVAINSLSDVRNNDNLLQIVANAWHN